MKVIFLDIDGVINSNRTVMAFDGYPFSFEPGDIEKFDQVAITLIRKACLRFGAVCVLSSTWRKKYTPVEVTEALNIPVIDSTVVTFGHRIRGHEIREWLEDHPEVTSYVIIDDNSDMLDSQLDRFIHVDGENGFMWKDYEKLCSLLGTPLFVKNGLKMVNPMNNHGL